MPKRGCNGDVPDFAHNLAKNERQGDGSAVLA